MMSTSQPSELPAKKELPADSPIAAGQATAWRSGPGTGLVVGLAAGLLAWFVMRAVHPVFFATEGFDQWGFLPLDVQWALDRNNSMFVLGLLGGLSGAGLAIGEGLARRSWKTVLAAGVACAAVGAAFGALGGYLGHRAFEFFRTEHDLTELQKAMGVNGLMFGTLGAGVGLGVGLVLGRTFGAVANCLIAGLLVGGLAAVVYPVMVAYLMPGVLTSVLLPVEAKERLVWLGLAGGLVGLIVSAVARPRATGKPPA